ncbi:MAG: DUF4190 domain-containing protein [Actinomycetota bacterium]
MSDLNPPTGGSGPVVDPDDTWGRPLTPTVHTGPQRAAEPAIEIVGPGGGGEPSAAPGGYSRRSLATPAVACSIAALVCCGLTGPIGMVLGALDMRAIDAGVTDPSQRGRARTAFILGAVATILLAVVVGLSLVLGSMSMMRAS